MLIVEVSLCDSVPTGNVISPAQGGAGTKQVRLSVSDMSINSRLFIGLCLVAALVSCPGSGPAKESREHHVAVSGSDTRGNGTQEKPWRTVAFAVSGIKGGDIVTVHGGLYREKGIGILPSASGSTKYPTTIRAAEGEEVTIRGVDAGGEAIYTVGVSASHVMIEGLKIIGFSRTAKGGKGGTLYVGGGKRPCTNVKIRRCELINSGKELGASNPSIVVFNSTENCEISNCRIYGLGTCDRDGIKIWSGTSRLLVQGNEVFNLLRRGIDNKHGGRDRHLTIINNYVHDVGHLGIHLNGDQSLIENNVLYKCRIGIGVWRNEGRPGGSHSTLNHNTLVNCGNGIILGFGPAGAEGFRSCTVTNNILLNCSGEFPELSINPYNKNPFDFGHTIDFNCYYNDRNSGVVRHHTNKPYTLIQWRETSGQDAHSVQENPELLGEPDNFNDLCDFRVSKGFAKSFQTSDGKVVGADIQDMKNCTDHLPRIPSNVRISTP